ncbi:MAG: hypothetical protein ACXVA9_12575 [Bdellovibrionales bacterium]
MKIVSVVVFTAALIGSWMLAHAATSIPETMHVGIQNDLKNIIAEYVQKNLPSSKNLRFEKFWTETVKKDQVKATFVYSFEDTSGENGDTTIEIAGSALLNKGEETAETVTWNLNSLQIKDSHVDFQEPIHITAGKGPPEQEQ